MLKQSKYLLLFLVFHLLAKRFIEKIQWRFLFRADDGMFADAELLQN